jgi:serine/threonine protein kinase
LGAGFVMEREIFLEHYRICRNEGGAAKQFARAGEAVTYEAKGIKTDESFALQLVPKSTVDLDAHKQFEEQARAIQTLAHPHIARLIIFGTEGDDYVFVSEYLPGETVESWVTEHGPMPPDASVRVALQVTSALIAAANLGLMHRAIEPANLAIVPGETAEGGWPYVKLINFRPGAMPSEASAFASPERTQNGTVDFRSEIYSLGATMCFLLSGTAASDGARLQQLSQFPKPLRRLLAQMLRPNPEERPQDSALFAEALRNTLRKVEYRQAFARRFGIPAAAVTQKTSAVPARSPLPRVLAFAVLFLASAAIAAVLLPENVVRHVWPWSRDAKEIGVPIGLPEASPAPSPALAANATIAPTPEARSTSTPVMIAQDENTEPEAPTEGPDTEEGSDSTNTEAEAEPSATPEAPAKSQRQTDTSEQKSYAAAKPPRAQPVRPNQSSPRSTTRSGSPPARYLGTTPDGMLIFGLPNGEIKLMRPRAHRFRHYQLDRRSPPNEPPPF